MALEAVCESITGATRGWKARIDLEAELVPPRTILRSARHVGPLRVQRALHPEQDGTCHLLLLHPPGGVVGGDELEVSLCVGDAANVLLTTPGATKIYRCELTGTTLDTRIQVGSGARCEWLPQETILFDGAITTLSTKVKLHGDASYIGWDVLCFGRPSAGERFEHGRVVSKVEIHRDERVLFNERLCVLGDSPILEQSWGLGGCCVIGTLVIAICHSKQLSTALLAVLDKFRAESPPPAGAALGVTEHSGSELEDLFVFRARGTSAEDVKRALCGAWQLARQRLGADGKYWPRIWST